MPGQWFRGLDASMRERYPALLSFAVMLTPDLAEAQAITDAAITSVMGTLRPPRGAQAREFAIHTQIARQYLRRHADDAALGKASAVTSPVGSEPAPTRHSDYAPPVASDPRTNVAQERDEEGLGLAKATSPLAAALASLTPAERVAALSWWIDGIGADEVAERLGVSSRVAVDTLHRAGITLTRANGNGEAPPRDHYLGTGDVVMVEVSSGGARR